MKKYPKEERSIKPGIEVVILRFGLEIDPQVVYRSSFRLTPCPSSDP
ncbi:MAG TPA: hypothetical protein VEH09_00985 [Thermodesulfobacteriota bacterium]|nr:hypothetical protein [Thermodesulfobacteriota bacterium]